MGINNHIALITIVQKWAWDRRRQGITGQTMKILPQVMLRKEEARCRALLGSREADAALGQQFSSVAAHHNHLGSFQKNTDV